MNEISKMNDIFTVSLTGGEPLFSVEFLEAFLPLLKAAGHRIYLETNGTLPDNLTRVIEYVDVISADIKLESSTGMKMNIIKGFLKSVHQKKSLRKLFLMTILQKMKLILLFK